MDGLQFFDREQDFTVAWRRLPHWTQDGTVTFLTWRTADSLPTEVLKQFAAEREELLREYGITGNRVSERRDYRTRVSPRREQCGRKLSNSVQRTPSPLDRLPPLKRRKLQWKLFRKWDEQLDRAAGECVLAQPKLGEIVQRAILYFDGARYVVTDLVVMPNHAHVLAAFPDADAMDRIVESWKRFSARQVNEALGQRGEFWQVEQFDHLVRSEKQFEYLREYIADNPVKAGLAPGTWRHYSKKL